MFMHGKKKSTPEVIVPLNSRILNDISAAVFKPVKSTKPPQKLSVAGGKSSPSCCLNASFC